MKEKLLGILIIGSIAAALYYDWKHALLIWATIGLIMWLGHKWEKGMYAEVDRRIKDGIWSELGAQNPYWYNVIKFGQINYEYYWSHPDTIQQKKEAAQRMKEWDHFQKYGKEYPNV